MPVLGIMNWVARRRRLFNGRPWFLPAPLTEYEVTKFEKAQGIRLPEDYRDYLLTVAGAPPGYAQGFTLKDCLGQEAKYGDFLQSPFPHSQDWNDLEHEDYHEENQVVGSLLLTHEGCGYFLRLVVTGPMRGTVWEDSRGSDCGLSPLRNADGTPLTFKEWIDRMGWMALIAR